MLPWLLLRHRFPGRVQGKYIELPAVQRHWCSSSQRGWASADSSGEFQRYPAAESCRGRILLQCSTHRGKAEQCCPCLLGRAVSPLRPGCSHTGSCWPRCGSWLWQSQQYRDRCCAGKWGPCFWQPSLPWWWKMKPERQAGCWPSKGQNGPNFSLIQLRAVSSRVEGWMLPLCWCSGECVPTWQFLCYSPDASLSAFLCSHPCFISRRQLRYSYPKWRKV